jgi:hypothetical protein
MEALGLNLASEHEERAVKDRGRSLAVRIEESKSDRGMTGIRQYVGLQLPGISEKGEARTKDVMPKGLTELIRGGQGAVLVPDNWDHTQHDASIARLRGDNGVRTKDIIEDLMVPHNGGVLNVAAEG